MKFADKELPELIGTEKQISWAMDLRAASLALYDRIVDESRRLIKNDCSADVEYLNLMVEIIESAAAETNAQVWIECRERVYDQNGDGAPVTWSNPMEIEHENEFRNRDWTLNQRAWAAVVATRKTRKSVDQNQPRRRRRHQQDIQK